LHIPDIPARMKAATRNVRKVRNHGNSKGGSLPEITPLPRGNSTGTSHKPATESTFAQGMSEKGELYSRD